MNKIIIGKFKNQRKAKGATKKCFAYWKKSINRLGIFADKQLSPGILTNGIIDKKTRLENYKVFKEFLKGYWENIPEEKRPFSYGQEDELRRVFSGGMIAS